LGKRFGYKLKVLLGYQRILNLKNAQTLEGRSKKKRDLMKVEKGGVHHKMYDVCCTKQWARIPKAT